MMTLEDIKLNQIMTVKALSADGLASKLMDMGMYPGKLVQVVFKAPFGGPIAIDLDGYTLSLRRDEASLVEVE